MEIPTTLADDARARVREDLVYWQKKLAHFEKTKNNKGIKVAKLLLNKYLDDFNNIK